MHSVLVDRHRLRDAGVHFGTPTGDLGIPCVNGAGFGSRIEAADQFERKSGTFLGGKTENLGKHVGGGHWLILAASGRGPDSVIRNNSFNGSDQFARTLANKQCQTDEARRRSGLLN